MSITFLYWNWISNQLIQVQVPDRPPPTLVPDGQPWYPPDDGAVHMLILGRPDVSLHQRLVQVALGHHRQPLQAWTQDKE